MVKCEGPVKSKSHKKVLLGLVWRAMVPRCACEGRLPSAACFLVLYALLLFVSSGGRVNANILLIGKNVSLSFNDIEANFAPSIKGSGMSGSLYVAEPLDACSPLIRKAVPCKGMQSPFVLIIRGGCNFDDKVRTAENAGFKAAIVFDDEDNGALVAMAGDPAGIHIHAVFVSKASGEILKKYAGLTDVEVWIILTFENSAWSIMAISFISLLAMSAVLATCFFVRRHRIRREQPRAPYVREFHGMSCKLVKAMPSLIFTSALEDNCTSITCAICLQDYSVGEKLRVLPCRHKFHAVCVDSWLTTWRTFCPVCKRDARTSTGAPPASESTPLLSHSPTPLSTAPSSVRSSFVTSSALQVVPSFRSSAAFSSPHSTTSSAIQIPPASFQSWTPHSHSLSGTSHRLQSFNSPRRSCTSHLASPYSMGIPSLASPLNSQYIPSFIPSSGNGSLSYLGSSSRQTFLRHCSDSAASFSPLASAQSLPGC